MNQIHCLIQGIGSHSMVLDLAVGEPQGAPSKRKGKKQDGVNDDDNDMYRETT